MPIVVRALNNLLLVAAVGLPLQHGATSVSGLEHPWRAVSTHWQIVADATESTSATDAREGTRGKCPEGMVDVRGKMMVDGVTSIESLQNTTCSRWIDHHFPERCATFDREKWLRASEHEKTRPIQFCIDRFEYPNLRGEYPIIDVTWRESSALCSAQGKRLCTEDQWTFACEGEEALPYPTGYSRDDTDCVIDRPWRLVDEESLSPREGKRALVEIDRLWQGEASGTGEGCKSKLGVYDLTGNVDEWTSSVDPRERPSVLKGGYWGPDRARCRPSTRVHGEDFSYYQQGFRCCHDVN